MLRSTKRRPLTPHSTGDPSDPLYQEEYRARKRYIDAQDRLRQMLEAGELEAAILDPWTGKLHQASASLWRQHDADRMIEKGQAPIPGSPNTGQLLIKQFAEAKEPNRPIPTGKNPRGNRSLEGKNSDRKSDATEQKDFLRKTFASYHITERQLNEIFRAVPVPTGRPRKSDK